MSKEFNAIHLTVGIPNLNLDILYLNMYNGFVCMSKNPRESNAPDYSGWRIVKSPGAWDVIGLSAIILGTMDCVGTVNSQAAQQIPFVPHEQVSTAQTVVADFHNRVDRVVKDGGNIIIVPQIADENAVRQSLEINHYAEERPKKFHEAREKVIQNSDINYRGGSLALAGLIFLAGGISLQVRYSRI